MIDKATHDGVLATCNMSDVGPLAAAARGVRLEADWEVEAGVAPGSKRRPLGFSPLRDAATGRAVVSAGQDCDGWTNQVREGSVDPSPFLAPPAGEAHLGALLSPTPNNIRVTYAHTPRAGLQLPRQH